MLLKILTLGWWGRSDFEEFMSSGDYEYWPFINEDEYKAAMENPKLLREKPLDSKLKQK